MKKIIFSIFLFSTLFISLTFLNYRLEIIETKVNEINILNKKLENELSFLKSEWEYITSPQKMSLLTKVYFKHVPAELIDIQDFIEIFLKEGEIGE